MSVVSVQNIEKGFAGRRLFAGVSFALDAHDHAVLVGRNGSGKTTLLRILAGTETPDSGVVARARGRRVWLHEQTPELERDRPVVDYLVEAFGETVELEAALRAAEERLSSLGEHSPELRDAMRAYQQLQRRFEAAGGYDYRNRLAAVLEGLGLPEAMLERRLLSLSGGELTRVTLARALLADADLLLLDEPTNHLDIDSVEWLERFLAESSHAFLLVTHDRRLLEAVGRRVLSLEHEHVETQRGDFATYLREYDARLALVHRRYEEDLEKIAQLQRYYDRFHAKKNKARQAKAKLTQMERIKRDLKAPPRKEANFTLGLPQPRPSARVVLEVEAPALRAGSVDEPGGPVTLIERMSLVVERGEKIALVGPNGAGKTTLVETIAGLRSLPEGAVHLGHNARPAYFSQQGRELDEEETVLATVLPLVGHDEQRARSLLGRFMFTADEVVKQVGSLSGGERSRLRLLALLVGDANFLLLDEPTNHLDMESVDALAEALSEYSGTLLLVTHDRHLIDRVTTRVLEIHEGRLLAHLSPARYWETRAARAENPPSDGASRTGSGTQQPASDGEGGSARHAPAGGNRGHGRSPAARTGSAAPAGAAASRQLSGEEARRQRARLRAAEAAVLKAERRLGEIDAELAEPSTYEDRATLGRLLEERAAVEGRLAREYDEWARLVDQSEA
jgi:ATP-binding cassette subfamily F protein 3